MLWSQIQGCVRKQGGKVSKIRDNVFHSSTLILTNVQLLSVRSGRVQGLNETGPKWPKHSRKWHKWTDISEKTVETWCDTWFPSIYLIKQTVWSRISAIWLSLVSANHRRGKSSHQTLTVTAVRRASSHLSVLFSADQRDRRSPQAVGVTLEPSGSIVRRR